jgi:2-polyprenyl-3-methyl-5-hydroxy-6-metoxy-1,4-benzoquinol methylase
MIDQRRTSGDDPVNGALVALVRASSTVAGGQPQVVDVGGGSGTRAVPLAVHGCQVTVVDTSVDALAILHRRAQDAGVEDRIGGVQADADQLTGVIAAGTADLVLCHHLLEEVDDPADVVRELAAAVRPGGHVSVLTAGRLGAVLGQTLVGRFTEATRLLENADGRFGDTDPLRRRFDAAVVVDMLTDAGLQVQSVTGVGVLAGLVSGAARQAAPGGDGALAELEATASRHPTLRELAADLHVVARRPDEVDGAPG